MNSAKLQKIMSEYGPSVYRLALVRLKRIEDAEDVYQETFLRFYRQNEADEWDPEHCKAWLLKVALNCCRDYVRRSFAASLINIESIENLPATIPEDQRWIWEYVMRLPRGQRLVVQLFYAEECSGKEISEILGISENAVRGRLFKAKKNLQRMIGENENEFMRRKKNK